MAKSETRWDTETLIWKSKTKTWKFSENPSPRLCMKKTAPKTSFCKNPSQFENSNIWESETQRNTRKQDFETHSKRLWDFKIGTEISETLNFLGIIRHPLLCEAVIVIVWLKVRLAAVGLTWLLLVCEKSKFWLSPFFFLLSFLFFSLQWLTFYWACLQLKNI